LKGFVCRNFFFGFLEKYCVFSSGLLIVSSENQKNGFETLILIPM